MTLGKSVRIYLADANVTGIRHGEIVNWTGQAISCPRPRLQDLKHWQEAQRPGVYFLIGSDEETAQDAVYIGEAEVVIDRLPAHVSTKDFWSEIVAFTSKDDNLTKAHVKYLESRLIQLAREASRYVVKNSNLSALPALPRADRDAMEEFIEGTKTLLGVLGHKLLEPLVTKTNPKAVDSAVVMEQPSALVAECDNRSESYSQQAQLFRLQIAGLTAQATRTNEGIVVLEGSEASNEVQSSLSKGYVALREQLIESSVLRRGDCKLTFAKDHLFSSPTQAAAIVVGYSINGRDAWRLKDGTSLATFEDRLSETVIN